MLDTRRKALAFSIGWWLLRRRLRKGASSAALGLLAGEALAARRKRHTVRNLLFVAMLAAAALFVWKRLQDGGEDWGAWEPESPEPAPSGAAEGASPAAA